MVFFFLEKHSPFCLEIFDLQVPPRFLGKEIFLGFKARLRLIFYFMSLKTHAQTRIFFTSLKARAQTQILFHEYKGLCSDLDFIL